MRIHILGICGTFMAGVARLAKQLGHDVSGSDTGIYPPMSTQLENNGITLYDGFDAAHLQPHPDLVIIGNALKRGIPAVEYVLDQGIPYSSGPEWLFNEILSKRTVLAVAGTHGKTTTASMLNWILSEAGLNPGYLIGGVPGNVEFSAKCGQSPYFVIEADEYDSAFFDKRSKFLHYRPRVAILNNLEFDHADIFKDLADIQKQFHQLVRSIPGQGHIIYPANDRNLKETLAQGCWTPCSTFGAEQADWTYQLQADDGHTFDVYYKNERQGTVNWSIWGMHNVLNALAAIDAAVQVNVPVATAIAALNTFKPSARRMEVKGVINDITVFDDFAHHPTAIQITLAGLRARLGKKARIIGIMELRSYTMRTGHHQHTLGQSWNDADCMHILQPKEATWDVTNVLETSEIPAHLYADTETLINAVAKQAQPGDCIVVMSNGGFEGLHGRLLSALGK